MYIPIDSPLAPDADADWMLGDRVVSCVHAGAVPFALEGTVVGVYGEVCLEWKNGYAVSPHCVFLCVPVPVCGCM